MSKEKNQPVPITPESLTGAQGALLNEAVNWTGCLLDDYTKIALILTTTKHHNVQTLSQIGDLLQDANAMKFRLESVIGGIATTVALIAAARGEDPHLEDEEQEKPKTSGRVNPARN